MHTMHGTKVSARDGGQQEGRSPVRFPLLMLHGVEAKPQPQQRHPPTSCMSLPMMASSAMSHSTWRTPTGYCSRQCLPGGRGRQGGDDGTTAGRRAGVEQLLPLLTSHLCRVWQPPVLEVPLPQPTKAPRHSAIAATRTLTAPGACRWPRPAAPPGSAAGRPLRWTTAAPTAAGSRWWRPSGAQGAGAGGKPVFSPASQEAQAAAAQQAAPAAALAVEGPARGFVRLSVPCRLRCSMQHTQRAGPQYTRALACRSASKLPGSMYAMHIRAPGLHRAGQAGGVGRLAADPPAAHGCRTPAAPPPPAHPMCSSRRRQLNTNLSS